MSQQGNFIFNCFPSDKAKICLLGSVDRKIYWVWPYMQQEYIQSYIFIFRSKIMGCCILILNNLNEITITCISLWLRNNSLLLDAVLRSFWFTKVYTFPPRTWVNIYHLLPQPTDSLQNLQATSATNHLLFGLVGIFFIP